MNETAAQPPPPNVLVVDDTPANLQLLVGMLKERGLKVRPVPSGEMALRAVQASRPDLILLDITMPGMDGYEVIARLKENEATRDIPVLFISALNETTDKVRSFQAGGVDYITKPFQLEEVEARVRTHLELCRQRAELKRSYEQLRDLERLRDDLTQMIVHDMRSPLVGLQLSMEVLSLSDYAREESNARMLRNANQAIAVLIQMVNQVLDVSRIESGQLKVNPKSCDVAALVREVIDSTRVLAGRKSVSTDASAPVMAEVDSDLIKRVLENLVGNALKFTPATGTVRVTLARNADGVRVEVSDNGPGIAAEDHQRIFEKFGQLEGRQKFRGSGLGLTFSKLAVEAHGGAIGVISAVGAGSTFWFTLPLKPGAL
jgi:two-component system sensor histidine kinase/response regulator